MFFRGQESCFFILEGCLSVRRDQQNIFSCFVRGHPILEKSAIGPRWMAKVEVWLVFPGVRRQASLPKLSLKKPYIK